MNSSLKFVFCIFIMIMTVTVSVLSQDQTYEPEKKVEVKASAFCKQVENLNPIDIGKEFSSDVGKVFFWTSIVTINPPTMIKHVWYYEDEKKLEVPLCIKYESTRTWSYKTIYPQMVGKWYVVIVDENNNVVKKCTFKINENMQ